MSNKSYAFCPVSDSQINERVARLNGMFIFLLLLIFITTGSLIPLVFLFLDFLLRAFELSRFSPFTLSSIGIVRFLGLSSNLINAGPKIFAARIGLFFSLLITGAELLSFHTVALSLSGVLALFSFLEAGLGFCVACELYPLLYRLVYKERE